MAGLLRKAVEWQALLKSSNAANQGETAQRKGITRARVTQVKGMLRPAPAIQEHILSLPDVVRRPAITERGCQGRRKTRPEGRRENRPLPVREGVDLLDRAGVAGAEACASVQAARLGRSGRHPSPIVATCGEG